jgi:hypothetical protein
LLLPTKKTIRKKLYTLNKCEQNNLPEDNDGESEGIELGFSEGDVLGTSLGAPEGDELGLVDVLGFAEGRLLG